MSRTDIAILTTFATIALIAALVGNAAAAPTRASCIDTHQGYIARPLNNHEVFVQNSLGKPRPPVRLTTSCYHLESATAFGLSAQFTCLAQGDSVVANLNGDQQSCVVTKIQPYVAQAGDLPDKR